MAHKNYLFTSESVTEGHPDKVCDQISDAILDAILAKEAELEERGYVSPSGVPACLDNVRCACETFATTGTIVVAGEIRTQSYVDVQEIVRNTLRNIGYDRAKYGFDCETCGVLSLIHEQSPDIAQGVDQSYDTQAGRTTDPLDLIGAGDQGMMFGFASDETDVLMPMPAYLAQRLAQRLSEVRKSGEVEYLRPDGKTQVTVRYEDEKPVEVTAIVISTQHAPEIEDMSVIKQDMIDHVIAPVMGEVNIAWDNADIYVNPTGRFVVGGPMGDTGLTGRKIIVDTYGGMGRHGGGAFSERTAPRLTAQQHMPLAGSLRTLEQQASQRSVKFSLPTPLVFLIHCLSWLIPLALALLTMLLLSRLSRRSLIFVLVPLLEILSCAVLSSLRQRHTVTLAAKTQTLHGKQLTEFRSLRTQFPHFKRSVLTR